MSFELFDRRCPEATLADMKCLTRSCRSAGNYNAENNGSIIFGAKAHIDENIRSSGHYRRSPCAITSVECEIRARALVFGAKNIANESGHWCDTNKRTSNVIERMAYFWRQKWSPRACVMIEKARWVCSTCSGNLLAPKRVATYRNRNKSRGNKCARSK